MRKILTFIAILSAVMALLDRVHVPPHIAEAAKSKPAVHVLAPPVPKIAPPPVAPPPPKYTRLGGCEQYRKLISKYDWDVRIMMAVMQAESTNTHVKPSIPCDSDVTGDGGLKFDQGGRTYGYSNSLLQVRILPGREDCDSHDPEINVACGYRIFKGQGYSAWSVYVNGDYLQYLR